MLNLIYTRPLERDQTLKEKINQLGFNITNIPCISFEYDFSEISKLENLENFDFYIFPSITSVKSLFEYLKKNEIDCNFLNNKSIAIGFGTKKTLESYLVENIISAQNGSTSEDLLKLDLFKNNNFKTFLNFRGSISREYIFQQLVNQKASIKEVILYKTIPDNNLAKNIKKINNYTHFNKNIILFTSISIIDLFLENAKKELKANIYNNLKNFMILVPSDRLEKYLRMLNFTNIYNSNQMSDSAIINKLLEIKKEHL